MGGVSVERRVFMWMLKAFQKIFVWWEWVWEDQERKENELFVEDFRVVVVCSILFVCLSE